MDTKAISDCFQLALAGQSSFLESLKILREAGVQRFHIDLARQERTCYSKNDEVYVEKFVLDSPAQKSSVFSEQGIDDAIAQKRSHQIEFVDVLRKYIESGVAGYLVFIEGDRIIYYGHNGEVHIKQLMWVAGATTTQCQT
jgi:uncharacterized protein YbcV (DUF1398 family)